MSSRRGFFRLLAGGLAALCSGKLLASTKPEPPCGTLTPEVLKRFTDSAEFTAYPESPAFRKFDSQAWWDEIWDISRERNPFEMPEGSA